MTETKRQLVKHFSYPGQVKDIEDFDVTKHNQEPEMKDRR